MDEQTKCCLLTPSWRPTVVPSRMCEMGELPLAEPESAILTLDDPPNSGAVNSIHVSKPRGLSRCEHGPVTGLFAVVIDQTLKHARNL